MNTITQLSGLRIKGDGVEIIAHTTGTVRLRDIGCPTEIDGIVIRRETREGFLIFRSADIGVIGNRSLFKIYQDKITAFIENFQTFGAIAMQNGDNFGCGEYAETPVLGNLPIDSTGRMICLVLIFRNCSLRL